MNPNDIISPTKPAKKVYYVAQRDGDRMSANVFYIARRDTEWRYYGPAHGMVKTLAEAQRYATPFDPALLERVAGERRAGGSAKIVRVTEVPGTTKREVIPEGQAYDPKAVQYAYLMDGYYFRNAPLGQRRTVLEDATLFPSHHDFLCDLTEHEQKYGFIVARTSQIVPVRITTTPSTFTEEVVK